MFLQRPTSGRQYFYNYPTQLMNSIFTTIQLTSGRQYVYNFPTHLGKARAVIDLGHTLLPSPLSQTDPVVGSTIRVCVLGVTIESVWLDQRSSLFGWIKNRACMAGSTIESVWFECLQRPRGGSVRHYVPTDGLLGVSLNGIICDIYIF